MTDPVELDLEEPEVLEIRELLCGWLENRGAELNVLIEWLQGNGLPTLDADDEPYESLLQGLPLADERYRAETELASRLASFLETKPDQHPSVKSNKLLYNLLMLCAGLSCPTQLAEPLYAIFQRRELNGSWEGFDLRQALESALITNQRDSRLEKDWREMLNQRKHPFLTGDEYAGFEGIRLMPSSEANRGEPAIDQIGAALAEMARLLKTRRDRRVEFHHLIDRILSTYPGIPTWDSDLIYQAHKREWPGWAVECLPRLFIPQQSLDSFGGTRALVWHYIAACVPTSFDYASEPLCNGYVLEVSMSQTASNFVKSIAPVFENNRLSILHGSDRAAQGVAAHSMAELEGEARARNDLDAALALQESRRRLLQRAGIISREPEAGDQSAAEVTAQFAGPLPEQGEISPNVDEIAKSLQRIAHDLEQEQNREVGFLSLVAPVDQMYPELDRKKRAETMDLPDWVINVERAA